MEQLISTVDSIGLPILLERFSDENFADIELDPVKLRSDLKAYLGKHEDIMSTEQMMATAIAIRKGILSPDDILHSQTDLYEKLMACLLVSQGPPSHGYRASVGLRLITETYNTTPTVKLDLCIPAVAYLNSEEAWSSDSLSQIACRLVDSLAPIGQARDELVDTVLQRIIRPRVSSAVFHTRAVEMALLNQSSTSAPWHDSGAYLKSMYSWVVSSCSPQYASSHWSQLLPILLNFIDDIDMTSRESGLTNAANLIYKLSPSLLINNGLGKVLREAIIPTLSVLPGLYSVEEVVSLLRPCYQSLFFLADKSPQEQKSVLLDKILREGVFVSYLHQSQTPIVSFFLFKQLGIIMDKMGIHGVKHLKDIIPLLSQALTDPFLPDGGVDLVTSAASALESVMISCWPRLYPDYTGEILEMLCQCWLNLEELRPDHRLTLSEAQSSLVRCGKVIKALRKEDRSHVDSITTLIKAQPKLSALLF